MSGEGAPMAACFAQDGNCVEISSFFHSAEDARAGNPYNTTFRLSVCSDGFSGTGEWECDIAALCAFARELEELYRFQREEAELGDAGCSSTLTFAAADRLGHIRVRGTLIGLHGVQRLRFEFLADQTALAPFVRELKALCGE